MGSLREAVASGNNREALEAIRDQLADKLDAGMCTHCGGPRGEASGIAALSLRLVQVMKDIDALPSEEEVSEVDELTAKRKRRRASTAAHLVDPRYSDSDLGPGSR